MCQVDGWMQATDSSRTSSVKRAAPVMCGVASPGRVRSGGSIWAPPSGRASGRPSPTVTSLMHLVDKNAEPIMHATNL